MYRTFNDSSLSFFNHNLEPPPATHVKGWVTKNGLQIHNIGKEDPKEGDLMPETTTSFTYVLASYRNTRGDLNTNTNRLN